MKNFCRLLLLFYVLTVLILQPGCSAAENLKLREGVSFIQDIDSGFPIVGEKIDDAAVEGNKPTLIFFGASGDLNTNRQAARLVSLYDQFRAKDLKFIVIDVGEVHTDDAKLLVGKYYKGYIPAQVLLDGAGSKIWSQIGEVELKGVKKQLRKVL